MASWEGAEFAGTIVNHEMIAAAAAADFQCAAAISYSTAGIKHSSQEVWSSA